MPSLPPPNDKVETDRVGAIAGLANLDAALFDAITAGDVRAVNNLLHELTSGDEGARRIARED